MISSNTEENKFYTMSGKIDLKIFLVQRNMLDLLVLNHIYRLILFVRLILICMIALILNLVRVPVAEGSPVVVSEEAVAVVASLH